MNNLEILFQGKSKDYGAYQLRLHYNKRLFISTLIGSLFLTLLSFTPYLDHEDKLVESNLIVSEVKLMDFKKPPIKEVKEILTKSPQTNNKSISRSNIKFTTIEVTDEEVSSIKSQDLLDRKSLGLYDSEDSTELVFPYNDIIEVKNSEEKIFTFAEETAKYNGDLYSDLSKLIVYPESEKQMNVECLLYVSFVVNKIGDVVDVQIVRGCDNQRFESVAVSAVGKLGRFTPAKMNGNAVSLRMTIPVKFSLR